MVKKSEKVILHICIIVALFVGGLCSGLAIRKGIDNKQIALYRSTIIELGSTIKEQRATIDDLQEGNTRLEKSVDILRSGIIEATNRAEFAERIIDELRNGLSGDIETIQQIKTAIRFVIKAVGSLGETE